MSSQGDYRGKHCLRVFGDIVKVTGLRTLLDMYTFIYAMNTTTNITTIIITTSSCSCFV